MIREAAPLELETVTILAARLWPEHTPSQLEPEFSEPPASDAAAMRASC